MHVNPREQSSILASLNTPNARARWSDLAAKPALTGFDRGIQGLMNSPYFLGPLSTFSLEGVRDRFESGACGIDVGTVFGLGTAHSDGPSQGQPIETIGMYLRALEFNHLFGLSRPPACLIAEGLPLENPALTRYADEIAQVSKRIQTLCARIDRAGLPITLIVDNDFASDSRFVELRDRSMHATPPFDATSIYAQAQTARFQYLADHHGYICKGGWSIYEDYVDVASQIDSARWRRTGMDESAFDQLSWNSIGTHSFGSYYGRTGWNSRGPLCPYIAKSTSPRILLVASHADPDFLHSFLNTLLETSSGDPRRLRHKLQGYEAIWEVCDLAAKYMEGVPKITSSEQASIAEAKESLGSLRESMAEREAISRQMKARLERPEGGWNLYDAGNDELRSRELAARVSLRRAQLVPAVRIVSYLIREFGAA